MNLSPCPWGQIPDAAQPLTSLHVTKVTVSPLTPRCACPCPLGDTGGCMGTPPLPLQVLGAMLGLGLFTIIIATAIVVLVRRLRLKSE